MLKNISVLFHSGGHLTGSQLISTGLVSAGQLVSANGQLLSTGKKFVFQPISKKSMIY